MEPAVLAEGLESLSSHRSNPISSLSPSSPLHPLTSSAIRTPSVLFFWKHGSPGHSQPLQRAGGALDVFATALSRWEGLQLSQPGHIGALEVRWTDDERTRCSDDTDSPPTRQPRAGRTWTGPRSLKTLLPSHPGKHRLRVPDHLARLPSSSQDCHHHFKNQYGISNRILDNLLSSYSMKRIQRHLAYANFAVFAFILCLVLYLNLSGYSASDKTFDWATVRYTSPSSFQPESRGLCPGLVRAKKPALVVSHVAADGDTKWLDKLKDRYHLCLYEVDAPHDASQKTLRVPANRGHEAMAFLTFMIDNYESIPSAGAVFVHGSRWAWHNDSPDYDNAALLSKLDVPSALEPHGYYNLRCDWSSSTCIPKESPPQGSLETTFKARLQPWAARAVSDAALPAALVSLFGGITTKKSAEAVLTRHDTVRSQCCAQFAVSQQRIHQHSKEEYIAMRQWLLDGGQFADAAPRDDRVSGRVLSYVWHILFAEPGLDGRIHLESLNTKACPNAAECYCRLYGRCNLQGCTKGRCIGQYSIPPGYKLPKDWEETHAS